MSSEIYKTRFKPSFLEENPKLQFTKKHSMLEAAKNITIRK